MKGASWPRSGKVYPTGTRISLNVPTSSPARAPDGSPARPASSGVPESSGLPAPSPKSVATPRLISGRVTNSLPVVSARSTASDEAATISR